MTGHLAAGDVAAGLRTLAGALVDHGLPDLDFPEQAVEVNALAASAADVEAWAALFERPVEHRAGQTSCATPFGRGTSPGSSAEVYQGAIVFRLTHVPDRPHDGEPEQLPGQEVLW